MLIFLSVGLSSINNACESFHCGQSSSSRVADRWDTCCLWLLGLEGIGFSSLPYPLPCGLL